MDNTSKLLWAMLLSCMLVACTSVTTPQGSYLTLGKADVTECEQMVFPDGQTPGKEAIGFNCKKYESSGVSGEFAAIVTALIDAIPGLPWVRRMLS